MMSSFQQLWQDGLRFADAGAGQRYVSENLSRLCVERGFSFWPCNSEIVPDLRGKVAYVGIASYDRADIEMLDAVTFSFVAQVLQVDRVVLFNQGECRSMEALERVMPIDRRFGPHTPSVSIWHDGRCAYCSAGFAMRRRLLGAGSGNEECE